MIEIQSSSKFYRVLKQYKQCIWIFWHMHHDCDFNCVYCSVKFNRGLKNSYLPPDLLLDGLSKLGGTLILSMTGGEPFVYPGFVELCAGITRSHYITIGTNLSTSNVYEFADSINPSKVLYIIGSLHILERERRIAGVREYLNKILYLQTRGFTVIASYVAYPPLLSRMHRDVDLLRQAGVSNVQVEAFKGTYGGRVFPKSYLQSDRELIRSLGIDFDDGLVLDDKHSFRGHLCMAGIKSFHLDANGQLRRCNASQRKYFDMWRGNFHPESRPRPCPFLRCCCPSVGAISCLERMGERKTLFSEILCEGVWRWSHRVERCFTSPSNTLKKVFGRVYENSCSR